MRDGNDAILEKKVEGMDDKMWRKLDRQEPWWRIELMHKILHGSGLTQMLNKGVEVAVADVDVDRATMGAIGDPCTTMKKVTLSIRLRVKRPMAVIVEEVIAEDTTNVVPSMSHDTNNSCGVRVVTRCVASANTMVK